MGEAIKKLTNEQIKFICEECGVMTDELLTLGEDDLYNRVYEKLCDVEIETIPDDDSEEESDRCKMASDLVTLLGKTLH